MLVFRSIRVIDASMPFEFLLHGMMDPSGVNLCALPTGPPRPGMVSNFVDPPSLAPVIVCVCATLMTTAVLTMAGRLFINRRNLTWSDCK